MQSVKFVTFLTPLIFHNFKMSVILFTKNPFFNRQANLKQNLCMFYVPVFYSAQEITNLIIQLPTIINKLRFFLKHLCNKIKTSYTTGRG